MDLREQEIRMHRLQLQQQGLLLQRQHLQLQQQRLQLQWHHYSYNSDGSCLILKSRIILNSVLY